MSQWGQQPGYQYPLQTGFQGGNPQFQQNPQFQPQFQPQNPQFQPTFTGLAPQPNAFLGPRPTGFQQPQQTGFSNPSGFLQQQPTGFIGGNFQQQPRPSLPPPVPPIPSQFQQPNLGVSLLGVPQPQLQQQANRFLTPSPGLSGLFSQQPNEEKRGPSTPIPWALSKAEKKDYDTIFRAWDTQGTGYIGGPTALEVFGQSGLSKEELADIWHLADIDNKGKLNMAEFHVAMGLIFRRLNGREIPAQLPPELVPPSARDLDTSVDFVKRVLANESRSRSPSSIDAPVSKLKERSFNASGPGTGVRQDATVYKHTDYEPLGGFYTPASRRVDRDTVRSRRDEDNPAADLSDMKRQLENAAKMLDRAVEADASRTAEDEALDREMQDLKYRVDRVQEDLEYVSRGSRTSRKDEERRGLEREMLELMHKRIPEVERKIAERDRRKEREKRQWEDSRNKRNDRHGRYDDRDRYSPQASSRRYSRERDDGDRGYARASYPQNDRDGSPRRERSRDREYDRPRTPPATRSPPAPPALAASSSLPPPASSRPMASPAPSTKNMTPEERQAYLRAEAKRRIDSRLQALGLTTTVSSPTVDTTVEERLAKEKKEAEEKGREAERQAEERELLRKDRLEAEKALKGGKTTPVSTPTATTTPTHPQPTPTTTPSVKPRAPPPPVRKKVPTSRPSVVTQPPAAPALPTVTVRAPVPAAAPIATIRAPVPAETPQSSVSSPPIPVAEPEVDPEEEKIRAREEALRKQREARAERLRQLEQEEEEAKRAEREYLARRQAFLNVKNQSPISSTPSAPTRPTEVHDKPADPTPPQPPPSTASLSSDTNPFRINGGAAFPADSTPLNNGSTNPFPRSHTAPRPVAPAPPKSPTPAAVKTSYPTVPGDSDDEWDPIEENFQDDSSDDEIRSSRDTRSKIAQHLFGNILPPARPQSAGTGTTVHSPPPTTSGFTPPAPTSPPAPPVAAVNVATPAPPPAPPAAPAAPIAAPPDAGDVGALMRSIQGGLKLKKAHTVDRSGPAVTGKVVGDHAPPHVDATPRVASPPRPVAVPLPASVPMSSETSSASSHRQSVDWYAGLAADQGAVNHLPPMVEEDEREEIGGHETSVASIPQIQIVKPSADAHDDQFADVDKSVELRVRTLYAYEGDRPEDLSFDENLIIIAHPSKSGGDWWYGTLVRNGKSGFLPSTYVQTVEHVKAKALYDYAGSNADELPFNDGEELSIVDTSDADWWKAEQGGAVFIVPSSYMEVVEAAGEPSSRFPLTELTELTYQDQVTSNRTTTPRLTETMPKVDNSPDSYSLSSEDSDEDEDELDEIGDKSMAESETQEEKERQLVLQAAGLIVTEESEQPPRPARTRSIRKRRPPPAAPSPRRSSVASNNVAKDLPPVPEPDPIDTAARLDDAFDRYEAFKLTHGNSNRMSVASIDTIPSSPGLSPTSPMTPSSSRDSENRGHSTLLQFLNRKTPVNDSDRRSMPSISAPIITTPSRENSPAFGTSWASLVDKSVLDEIPTDERRRQETIFELINTEAAYVSDLQLIVEVFYSSMLPLLDKKAVTVVFANIEDILLVNTAFLSSLEGRQKECRLYVDNIGDILQKHMPNMNVYMEYCVNQATAIKVLQSLRESNTALSSHLQRLRDDPAVRNLDLASYLLAPMQRITKYPLLIRQILNQHTEMAHDRTEIEGSLHTAEGILNQINESIREQEGRERLKQISHHLWIGQGRLDLTANTRYMGPRKLLKEGLLSKAKSGRKLRAFLCSDVLVLTDEVAKVLYRMPIPLADVQLKDARDDNCFQVSSRDGVTTILRATSVRDCQSWMGLIKNASKKCRKAEQMASLKDSVRGQF